VQTTITIEQQRKEQQKALKNIQEGGVATKVRILVADDACPTCKAIAGAYEFDEEIPEVPPEGCSCLPLSKTKYAPVLDMRGP